MAKTKGPLFSLGAHGSLGKELNYSRRRSGDQCRQYNKPTGVPSAKQRAQRRLTEFLIAQWQNMSAADKATWADNARGTGLNLSGYHYFLRSAQKDLYTHHGLAGYWHCNEIVGGQVLDLSGNGNHGTLKPSYPANAPTLVNSKSTRFSKALSYDGVDDYVAVAHNSIFDFGTDDFTYAYLLYVNGTQNDVDVVSKWDYPTYTRGLYTRVETGPVFTFHTGDIDGPTTIYQKSITLNTWLDIVCRRISTIIEVFVNGVSIGFSDGTIRNVNTPGDLNFGRAPTTGRELKGSIDEICLYNRGLSNAEITTRYKFTTQKVS